MAVVVGFHRDVISCELARRRVRRGAQPNARQRGNAVGLALILYRQQHSNFPHRRATCAERLTVGNKMASSREKMKTV